MVFLKYNDIGTDFDWHSNVDYLLRLKNRLIFLLSGPIKQSILSLN